MMIDSSGRKWFKGNLHTHTTLSDGQKSPKDTIDLYREHGYDFIALTDHWRFRENGVDGDMLILSGCEYDFGRRPTPDEGVYHILSIGAESEPPLHRAMTVQHALHLIKEHGGLTVLAHPAWSLNRPDKVEQLHNIDAVEIFNSVSDLPRNCRPYSGAFVDTLAAGGTIYPLVADDDTHFYLGEQCRSYIMVNAEALTPNGILQAIQEGNFYATQSPSILLNRDGDTITAVTSEVKTILFYSDSCWVNERIFTSDTAPLTSATYRIPSTDTFVRAEAYDAAGKCAWSNVIKVR